MVEGYHSSPIFSVTRALGSTVLSLHLPYTSCSLLDARVRVSTVPKHSISHTILYTKGKLMGIISHGVPGLIQGDCLTRGGHLLPSTTYGLICCIFNFQRLHAPNTSRPSSTLGLHWMEVHAASFSSAS